jgi:hypothetical protein
MLGTAVLCVKRYLQSRWVKAIMVRCAVCPDGKPGKIEDVLKHVGKDHAGQAGWEWFMQKWPLYLPIKAAGMPFEDASD